VLRILEVLSHLTPFSQYETDSREFRLKFEEFGEIKTFFDLISHRGMVFCTYVCCSLVLISFHSFLLLVRHEGGRTRQGKATRYRSCWSACKWFVQVFAFEADGGKIDVHYSLPREDQAEDRNQGILIVTLIDSPIHAPIDDTELKRKCAAFGDVKSISSHGRPEYVPSPRHSAHL